MSALTVTGPAAAFSVRDAPGPVVMTAIHAGHELRPELADLVLVDASIRLREEDPFTDRLAVAGTRVTVHRSRFEVDLNRPRADAVYCAPEDAWGLQVWKQPPSPEVVERSLAVYDTFYAVLADRLNRLAARGPFVVLDIHSYNHRRDGVPAPSAENPELNVGTGSLVRGRWDRIVDGFIDEMRDQQVDGHALDVRETSGSAERSWLGGSTSATPTRDAHWHSSSRSYSWTRGPASRKITTLPSSGERSGRWFPAWWT